MDKTGIYSSPAMVTVDVFLVSLFVGAERVCVFLRQRMCNEYMSEGEGLCEWVKTGEDGEMNNICLFFIIAIATPPNPFVY